MRLVPRRRHLSRTQVKLSNPEKIAQGIVALANTARPDRLRCQRQPRVEGGDDAEEVRDELVRICREDIVPALFPYIDLVSFDSGRRVVALDVEGRRRPYRTRDGRFFIRVGAEKREASREELSQLLDEARPVRYENIPVIGASLSDIDEAHLWSFVREFEGDAYDGATAAAGYPTGEVLERDLRWRRRPPGAKGADRRRFASLRARRERDELLPRSSVTVVRYAGDTTQAPKVEA